MELQLLLSDPLRAVGIIFDEARTAARDDHASLSKSDWGVPAAFEKCLSGNLSQVPEINTVPVDSIPPNSLVRFHGMVQDMFDVEYYIGMHKANGVWRTNKYTDKLVSEDFENPDHVIWERRLIYLVPVPGENQWVKGERISNISSGRDVMTQKTSKRQHESLVSATEDMECDVSVDEHKRLKTPEIDPEQGNTVPKWKTELNLLDKDSNLCPCLVKMYDGSDGSLKLNDVAEIVGILTYDPVFVPNEPSRIVPITESFLEDDISIQLPATKVPRLHCIMVKKLHSPYQLSQQPSDLVQNMALIRESLLVYLKSVLGEDRLAAEYLLLHLLSKVHSRVEPVAVGKFSLNFSGCEARQAGGLSPFAVSLAKTISSLLPRSHLLGLSLDDLNTSTLAPRKDYSTNRLVTGALQLAAGTHLTIDETALRTGELNQTGLKNLQCLKNLVQNQKIDYDFQFYNTEIPADVPVLVVSTAKSRLLPADALVPLKHMTSRVENLAPMDSDLFKWRMYLSHARELPHVIEPSIQKIVEDDLVAARQRDRTIGPDTFHKWLTMARLVSFSFGESSLTSERWEMVKNMEMSCTDRLGC